MRNFTATAVTLLLSWTLILNTAITGQAQTVPSFTQEPIHLHEQLRTIARLVNIVPLQAAKTEAPRIAKATPQRSHVGVTVAKRNSASPIHNHAAAPVFIAADCMRDCLREFIPDELLIACAVLCAGGVVPACAVCLGWYTGVAIGCAIDCSLPTSRNLSVPKRQRRSSTANSRNLRPTKKVIPATA